MTQQVGNLHTQVSSEVRVLSALRALQPVSVRVYVIANWLSRLGPNSSAHYASLRVDSADTIVILAEIGVENHTQDGEQG